MPINCVILVLNGLHFRDVEEQANDPGVLKRANTIPPGYCQAGARVKVDLTAVQKIELRDRKV